MLSTQAQVPSQEQSNRHFWHTSSTSAPEDAIWALWTDVSSWSEWDTGLKDASMEDSFQLDAKGKIISLEGRTSTFQVVAFEKGKSYTYKTNLPLGSLYVKRSLSPQNGRTSFTHEVWFSGLSRGIFSRMFGPTFRNMLPEVLENIKKIVEE